MGRGPQAAAGRQRHPWLLPAPSRQPLSVTQRPSPTPVLGGLGQVTAPMVPGSLLGPLPSDAEPGQQGLRSPEQRPPLTPGLSASCLQTRPRAGAPLLSLNLGTATQACHTHTPHGGPELGRSPLPLASEETGGTERASHLPKATQHGGKSGLVPAACVPHNQASCSCLLTPECSSRPF